MAQICSLISNDVIARVVLNLFDIYLTLLEIQTFGTHHSKWFSSVDALAVRTM